MNEFVLKAPTAQEFGAVINLRWEVLHDPESEIPYVAQDAYDADPRTLHSAAYTKDGLIVAAARMHTPSESPELRQIRYQATDPAYQRRGLGGMVVADLERRMVSGTERPEKIVANARITALGFWHSMGYVAVGKEFMSVGRPHMRIEKHI